MARILIIGKGNIGTFVGAALNTTAQITHLTRENKGYPKSVILNFNDRRSKKYKIKKKTTYQYSAFDNHEQCSGYDFIVIPVAHYHLREIITTIAPFLDRDQVLVIMGNVWSDFDWLKSNIHTSYIFAFPNFGGAIIKGALHGWLTPNFTTGVTDSKYTEKLAEFESILTNTGFKPKSAEDIKGWLMTHFAYIAGMLLEAAKQDGFRNMTKNISSLKNMYLTMKECMDVASEEHIDVKKFKEGRFAYQTIWWNVLKTYLIFLLPGLAKDADTTKNIEDWVSYSRKIWKSAKEKGVFTPILDLYHKERINSR